MNHFPPPLREWLSSPLEWALFLDFDGTLIDLAPTPDAIRVPGELPALLCGLEAHFSGALAILTGRALRDLDHFLAPPRWPAAGQHGAELRWTTDGECVVADAGALQAARDEIRRFAARHPGILVEDKGASIALHYRAVPAARQAIKMQVGALVEASAGTLEAIVGKGLYELRPAGVNKGQALRRLLEKAPFGDKKPLVLGDDVTDEATFEVALERGGRAIKVGSGETAAPWRLDDPMTVRGWLADLCD